MDRRKLVRMANDIAAFFAAEPTRFAIGATTEERSPRVQRP